MGPCIHIRVWQGYSKLSDNRSISKHVPWFAFQFLASQTLLAIGCWTWWNWRTPWSCFLAISSSAIWILLPLLIILNAVIDAQFKPHAGNSKHRGHTDKSYQQDGEVPAAIQALLQPATTTPRNYVTQKSALPAKVLLSDSSCRDQSHMQVGLVPREPQKSTSTQLSPTLPLNYVTTPTNTNKVLLCSTRPSRTASPAGPSGSISSSSKSLSSSASSRGGNSGSSSSGSLKAPVGLSRCTIAEDSPFPPPNTQVIMELYEKTLRIGSRRLRYRSYRPADRVLPSPQPQHHNHHPSNSLPAPPPPLPLSTSLSASARQTTAAPAPSPFVQYDTTLAAPLQYCQGDGIGATQDAIPQHHHPRHHNHHNRLSHVNRRYDLHRNLSVSVKIPWAHPQQLLGFGGGGGGSRLLESFNEALASGSGYMVVGGSVRPGCVVLQLDLVAAVGGPGTRGMAGGREGKPDGGSSRGCGTGGDSNWDTRWRRLTAASESDGDGDGGVGDEDCYGSGEVVGSMVDGESKCSALAEQLVRCMAAALPPPQPSILVPSTEDYGNGGEAFVHIAGISSYLVSRQAASADWHAKPFYAGTMAADSTLSVMGQPPGEGPLLSKQTQELLRDILYGVRLSCTRTAVLVVAQDNDVATAMMSPAVQSTIARVGASCSDKGFGGSGRAGVVSAAVGGVGLKGCPTSVHSSIQACSSSRGAKCGDASKTSALQLTFRMAVPGGDGAASVAVQLLAQQLQSLVAVEGEDLDMREGGDFKVVCDESQKAVNEQPPQPQQPSRSEHSHRMAGGWQLVANCLGRSLPVAVKQVTANYQQGREVNGSQETTHLNQDHTALLDGAAMVSLDVVIYGSREALETASCRMGTLSLELWYDNQHVVHGAVLVVHDLLQLPLSSCDNECCSTPLYGGRGAVHLVAELCRLASKDTAADGHCVRQLCTDLSILELYASSQRRRMTLLACTAHTADNENSIDTGDNDHMYGTVIDGESMPYLFTPLLPGSLDLSDELVRHMASDDDTMRRTMLFLGSNLLSYTVLTDMPYTASVVHNCLSSLGWSLAMADALSCAAATGIAKGDEEALLSQMSDEFICGFDCPVQSGTSETSSFIPYDNDEDEGLPLVHLAVLSGNLDVVRLVLQWAAMEGLGSDWLGRRHRGRNPLITAAVGPAAASSLQWRHLAPLGGVYGGCGGHGDVSGDGSSNSDDAGSVTAYSYDVYLTQLEHLLGDVLEDEFLRNGLENGRTAVTSVQVVPNSSQLSSYLKACNCSNWPFTMEAAIVQTPPATGETSTTKKICRTRKTMAAIITAVTAVLRRHPVWSSVLCLVLAAAFVRQLSDGAARNPVEMSVCVVFALLYLVLLAGLMWRPSTVHRQPRWLLYGVARLSAKLLCGAGLLPLPAFMVSYTRLGVTTVAETVLPGLCEWVKVVNSAAHLALQFLGSGAQQTVLLLTGIVASPVAAVRLGLLRSCLFLTARTATAERRYWSVLESRDVRRFAAVVAAGQGLGKLIVGAVGSGWKEELGAGKWSG